jgi:hypothetical protein
MIAVALLSALVLIATSEAGVRHAPALSKNDAQFHYVGFAIARDLHLAFHHQLGQEEAQRRVTRKLEDLRAQFAGEIGESTISWEGNVAHVTVSFLAQTALARVTVSDDEVTVDAHLPLLLAPLAGNISAFLGKTARRTLEP